MIAHGKNKQYKIDLDIILSFFFKVVRDWCLVQCELREANNFSKTNQ
jgi:hypothetical protein